MSIRERRLRPRQKPALPEAGGSPPGSAWPGHAAHPLACWSGRPPRHARSPPTRYHRPPGRGRRAFSVQCPAEPSGTRRTGRRTRRDWRQSAAERQRRPRRWRSTGTRGGLPRSGLPQPGHADPMFAVLYEHQMGATGCRGDVLAQVDKVDVRPYLPGDGRHLLGGHVDKSVEERGRVGEDALSQLEEPVAEPPGDVLFGRVHVNGEVEEVRRDNMLADVPGVDLENVQTFHDDHVLTG